MLRGIRLGVATPPERTSFAGVPVVANAEEALRAARQVEAAKKGFFGRKVRRTVGF